MSGRVQDLPLGQGTQGVALADGHDEPDRLVGTLEPPQPAPQAQTEGPGPAPLPALDDGDVPGMGEDLDPAALQEAVGPAGVVAVGVADHDLIEVLEGEPVVLDLFREPRGGQGMARVEQGQSAGPLDQEAVGKPRRLKEIKALAYPLHEVLAVHDPDILDPDGLKRPV